jgi:UDP-N-acetylglucosamine 2-epimerase
MAPVLRELQRRGDRVHSIVCVTGQHREMLEQALRTFDIVPDADLGLMVTDQGLSQLTARLFEALDPIVKRVAPEWVLAQGDTTSVFVAAMVAYYRAVAFGHVEAGLRTRDARSPFPEEINRRIADEIADALFAPTARARQTLLTAGRDARKIHVTGNTAVDALLGALGRSYDWAAGPLAGVPRDRRLVLVTAHRRESFGVPLEEICRAVGDLAAMFAADGVHIVFPVHANPHVTACAFRLLSRVAHVSLVPPLDYLSLVQLMKRSVLILTDSGGIQEEAPSLDVPVLVLRDVTERPEGVEAGVARVVGTKRTAIVAEAARLLRDPAARAAMTGRPNPYGDGHAARRIVATLLGEAWDDVPR